MKKKIKINKILRKKVTSIQEFVHLASKYLKGITKGEEMEITKISIGDLYFTGKCEANYRAPIGKKTNWCNYNKSIPYCYHGFKSDFLTIDYKLNIKTKKLKPSSISNPEEYFQCVEGLYSNNLGNGNGISRMTYHEGLFFLDDFPLIKKNYFKSKKIFKIKERQILSSLKSGIKEIKEEIKECYNERNRLEKEEQKTKGHVEQNLQLNNISDNCIINKYFNEKLVKIIKNY